MTRRRRAWQREHGRTLHELAKRIGAEPDELGRILREDVERGVIDYHLTSRRYSLNGRLPADVKTAPGDLTL